MNGLYTLRVRDFILGAIVAVGAAAFISVLGILQTVGFDIFTADWAYISRLAANGAFGGLVGYLTKNFFSNNQGEFAGKV